MLGQVSTRLSFVQQKVEFYISKQQGLQDQIDALGDDESDKRRKLRASLLSINAKLEFWKEVHKTTKGAGDILLTMLNTILQPFRVG